MQISRSIGSQGRSCEGVKLLIIRFSKFSKTVSHSDWKAESAAVCYTDEEGHLGGEDELVSLEETAGGVDEDRVGDAVDQINDALFHLLGRLGAVNRLLEHHAECLRSQNANSASVYVTQALGSRLKETQCMDKHVTRSAGTAQTSADY